MFFLVILQLVTFPVKDIKKHLDDALIKRHFQNNLLCFTYFLQLNCVQVDGHLIENYR